jgi:hypothetical protein
MGNQKLCALAAAFIALATAGCSSESSGDNENFKLNAAAISPSSSFTSSPSPSPSASSAPSSLRIQNLAPSKAAVGQEIAVAGVGFEVGKTFVTFYRAKKIAAAVDSPTWMRATVPPDAQSGPVRFVTSNGSFIWRGFDVTPAENPPVPTPVPNHPPDPSPPPPPNTTAFQFYQTQLEPRLFAQCGSCHSGQRFSFFSLQPQATSVNYEKIFDLISLDRPDASRLIAKILPESDPNSIIHAGRSQFTVSEDFISTARQWINLEKSERCPDCGISASAAYVAYVKAPQRFWAIDRTPKDGSFGVRVGARIMLQKISPATMELVGAPIDFLGTSSFCASGDCDFGFLTANHAGNQLAFECRVAVQGERWIARAWNICIAEIDSSGHAVNPRFLMPSDQRLYGWDYTRTSPFGYLGQDGLPLKSIYDDHFQMRQRNDRHPVFSPDDKRIYFSSERADPRTQDDPVESYHGEHHLANIIAVTTDGQDVRLIYKNEGGEADSPFFRRNGNLGIHTWNLDRMDRHMIIQATQDGMMEMPVLFGATQGPNMWGRSVEFANGLVLTMTGARRGASEQYAPIVFDHTLGTGTDPLLKNSYELIPGLFSEILPYPNGFCSNPPSGQNCQLSKMIFEPAYAADGRVLVTYNSETTYLAFGEGTSLLRQNTSESDSLEMRFQKVEPYLPKHMGVGIVDHHGNLQMLVPNEAGNMNRFATWVGKIQPPREQPWKTAESETTATLNIADFKLWLGFQFQSDGSNKPAIQRKLDEIQSVRVLMKDASQNACIRDTGPYWNMVHSGNTGNHPSAFGIADSTGFIQLVASPQMGGNTYGDIPLQSDHSISVKVPAGKLLLFQGVDANGHVIAQHGRLFAMPPGHSINTSVRRDQYFNQCASCHGSITNESALSLRDVAKLDATLTFDTLSQSRTVDISSANQRKLTFLHAIRPLLDSKCVSCHSGSSPAAGLSLSAKYSESANFPASFWNDPVLTTGEYLFSYRPTSIRTGFDFSMTYKFLLHNSDGYKDYPTSPYRNLFATDAALGGREAWDPAYQNLFRRKLHDPYNSYYFYLSEQASYVEFGRSSRLGGNSSSSFLIEILTGRDLDRLSNLNDGGYHASLLSEAEKRLFMAVIDVGFPYMSRCDDKLIPRDGLPNSGEPWGGGTYTRWLP